jgi:hypothetical protein
MASTRPRSVLRPPNGPRIRKRLSNDLVGILVHNVPHACFAKNGDAVAVCFKYLLDDVHPPLAFASRIAEPGDPLGVAPIVPLGPCSIETVGRLQVLLKPFQGL